MLPRPRRFGKTLNLSMLRYFFEKTDIDTSRLFRKLGIWEQGEAYRSHQGQYPVIYLTFKDVKCSNWDHCFGMLGSLIAKEYGRHRYLLADHSLSGEEAAKFKGILGRTAAQYDYCMSIRDLSELLHKRHGQKVVILIDEYDTPIQEGYLNGYHKEIVEFMRALLGSALKDNPHQEKAVLTGILRVAKESIFSGLNHLSVHTMLSPQYNAHFGLLEQEVEQLLDHYRLGSDMNDVKLWYKGYIFGGQTVYNPWSIINYADRADEGFRPYWVNTSGNDLIRGMVTRSGRSVKEDMERLLQGESVTKSVDDNIVFGDMEKSGDAIWSFLLFCGYLKALSATYADKRLTVELAIPNAEVEYLYEDIILGWFRESVEEDHLRLMLQGLAGGDLETFEYIFRDFIGKTFSYFDVGGQQPEKVYHAFVLGLLVGLNKTHEVKSNRESGLGRYDVMLIPRNAGEKGVIIEFKKVNPYTGETLEEAAGRALEQIARKRYAEELAERGIREVIRLGIAFQGKEVLIKSSFS